MKEKTFETHINELSKRYCNEKLINKAATRRMHLDYNRISVGGKKGKRGKILNLLSQAHSTYYLGFFEATCALCGNLLEQVLTFALITALENGKKIIHEVIAKNGMKITNEFKKPEDFNNKNLFDLISLCENNGILKDKSLINLCHEIRYIRNETIHNALPIFRIEDNKKQYLLKIKKTNAEGFIKIKLKVTNIDELKKDIKQATPYYCLISTRKIMHEIFVPEK